MLTALQKVILSAAADASFFVITAYEQVHFTDKNSCALHNELFTLLSES